MRALLCSALLALAACHTLAPLPATPWSERRASLQALDKYEVNGQLAVATASEGFSANLRWQQQGVASDLLLRAPLGVGGAHLNFDGEVLRVTNSQGTQLEGATAQAELVRVLGFEPPLTSLRYWLLGAPNPVGGATETLDGEQRLAQLQQGEWQVDYGEYQRTGGLWLPRRVALHRGEVKVKLQLSHWQLP
ncbi:MAG TPA: lipoprotein insertase outer membrane protein LolB [Steroidobacteraceae bacterium]|jgi:outer membrane lipoprotein LolB|nr:lipoprotein insertase outer membrane protein LolB [Steroidobacteraceae bacterium]